MTLDGIKTHKAISETWVGSAVQVGAGHAVAELLTRQEMAADERLLVHGSFAFGLADYAAMLAVNDPFVVLGAAEAKFLAPVRVGETLVAEARVDSEQGKKRKVLCQVTSGGRAVFEGVFTCFVLEKHVMDS